MKKIAPLLLLALSLNCFAQTAQDTTSASKDIIDLKKAMYQAGLHLENYSHRTTTSYIFMGAGTGIALAGATSNRNAAAPLVILGSGLSLVGFILNLTAHGEIGRAGKIFKANGIAIDLGTRRR